MQVQLIPLDPLVLAKVEKLTDHMRHIMNLSARGWSTKDIGAKLKISPHTVASYTKSLRETFNVNSQAQLAVIAAKAGLV